MSSPRPGAPLPPYVYRRRRILALAVLAVVVWLLVAVISGIVNLFTGGNSSKPAATQSAPAAAATDACAPGSVAVTGHVGSAASEDQSAFAKTAQPYIWFTIENTTAKACKFDYVAGATFFTITSGAETIWSNKDCATFAQGQDTVIDLQPNSAQASAPIVWPKSRSSQSTGCELAGNAAAAPGAYHLVATVSNIHSADVQFLIN